MICTVLSTALEGGIDSWLLLRVGIASTHLYTVVCTTQARFVPVTAFIFSLELLFLALQVYTIISTMLLFNTMRDSTQYRQQGQTKPFEVF